MIYDEIKKTGTWDEASDSINNNFNKTKSELESVASVTKKFKGYFATPTLLNNAFASPSVGDYAWVGTPYPGVVYKCEVKGVWLATTNVPPTNTVDLNNYVDVWSYQPIEGVKDFVNGATTLAADSDGGVPNYGQLKSYALKYEKITSLNYPNY